MSGRDLRAFLQGHRAGTFNCPRDKGLAQKYLAGGVAHGGRGLHKVDYEQLLSQALDHQETALTQVSKLKALSKQGQDLKGAGLLRLHREVWLKEWEGLVSETIRVERELEEWRTNLVTVNEGGRDLIKEVSECMAEVYQEGRCGQDILTIVRQLTAEIKQWLKSPGGSEAELQSLLCSVKEQHGVVLEGMCEECRTLWCEIELCSKDMIPDTPPDKLPQRDIPNSLQELDCSDPVFKASLLSEFEQSRSHFEEVLTQLCQRHQQAISSPHGGWPREDAERFAHILEQYHAPLRGRRTAYLDRLGREFPQYSRQQLVEHESWYFSMLHFSRQRAACLRDWGAHHKELEVRVQAALEAYEQEAALKEAVKMARDEQQALCRELHHKVTEWREEKTQLLLVQAQEEAALLSEQQALREKEEERRKKKQRQTRLRLQTYHDHQEARQAQEEAWLERVRQEREGVKREEAIKGQGRVKYRKEQLLNKLSQQKEVLKQKAKEEEEREERLAALRNQVKVHVTSDPERVHQETVSVQARSTFDPELPAQQPLFAMHGYSSNKVTSDPRVRLEEALRKAGLHESEYARRVMRGVKPPTMPRPDQQSSLFPSNHT